MQTNTHTKQPTMLLGITGGIAAYKAAEFVRLMQKRGYRVKCVMTRHACEFIGPTTLRGLTHEPVALDEFENPSAPMRHLSLAQECDVFAILPATANCLAKIAHGVADDLLTTTALATDAPLVVAPAMNTAMWQAAQTQEACMKLKMRGATIVEPAEGYLACGDTGQGKLADLEVIARAVEDAFSMLRDLKGQTVLITAGPTRERIDEVRFLSNDSSGKMGYALARQAHIRGAQVILISGPVSLPTPRGVEIVRVESAQEMLEASMRFVGLADIVIGAAAVADYAPAERFSGKIKRNGEAISLNLRENPDIIATLAHALREKGSGYCVAFAAEAESVVENARKKLIKKGVDLVVANNICEPGIGFNGDNNEVTLITKNIEYSLQKDHKERIASAIISFVIQDKEHS